jgi:hypothetical protein
VVAMAAAILPAMSAAVGGSVSKEIAVSRT